MGNTAKIIYLNHKNWDLNSNMEKSEGPQRQNNRDVFLQELNAIFNKAQNQIRKIEEDWELDHATVTIRDDIHVIKFYLKIMKELLREI